LAHRGNLAVVLALLICLLPGCMPAQGQTLRHRDWELAVFGGGSFLGSGSYATPVTGSIQQTSRTVGLNYGDGYLLGASVTENRGPHFGAALEYSFSNQPLTITNLTDSTPSLGLGHSIHRFAYDLIYYLKDRDSRLRPFAFAGPGVSLFHVGESGRQDAEARGIHLSSPWKFTMNFGGGIKCLLKDQIAASLQFSDSVSGVPGYGLPSNGSVVSGKYTPGFRPDGFLNNWRIGLSFIYQWDHR
jgi:hypothetical protein